VKDLMLANQNNWDYAVSWLFSCPEVDYVLITLGHLQVNGVG